MAIANSFQAVETVVLVAYRIGDTDLRRFTTGAKHCLQ